MARLLRPISAAVLIAVSVSLLGGCAALVVGAAAGAGGYAWVRGELARVYDAPYEKTWNASLDALKYLEMAITDMNKDKLEGTISAKRADDTAVKINIESLSEKSTRIKIRVGVFGDRPASERIHEEIAKRL